MPGAEIVWSPSPASLLILDQYLRSTEAAEARGVQVSTMGKWEPVTVALEDRDTLMVNGVRHRAAWSGEVPERVEGWFELLPEGHPPRP
jgi:hypothetical protein